MSRQAAGAGGRRAAQAALCALALAACSSHAPSLGRERRHEPFQQRVAEFLELSDRLAVGLVALEEGAEPGAIAAHKKALAERIRVERAAARQGDIFTPEIAAEVRETVRVDFQGTFGQAEKTVATQEAPPASEVKLAVNADYPDDQALSTMPPNLLMKLPAHPEGVDYRFVGRHLVLRSVAANIIVDYVENAVPAKQ